MINSEIEQQQLDFVRPVWDPNGRLKSFLHDLRLALRLSGKFALCIGSTATSDLEGMSAAGADGSARRLTPAIDAEALVLGAPLSAEQVPVSPRGIVSPVVLSRAMLSLVNCSVDVFDCGAFYPPKLEHRKVGQHPAACPDSGLALPLSLVQELFSVGRRVGKELASQAAYVIVGECVPGGTTTALGVLTALGYSAEKLVSSSMPLADHNRRSKLIRSGLEIASLTPDMARAEPLRAVAAVGDPMQAFAAGIALEASKHVPVVLGGGTQMLAVFALASALAGVECIRKRPIAVVTTKWVAFDSESDPALLAELVGAPFAASCPNFHGSRHPGLRAYEQGNVKEGVAAGAMMALAHLSGKSERQICEAVDSKYDQMVGGDSHGAAAEGR